MAVYTLSDEQEEDFMFANKMPFAQFLEQNFIQWTEVAKANRKHSLTSQVKNMDDEMVKKLVHTAGITM